MPDQILDLHLPLGGWEFQKSADLSHAPEEEGS